MTESQGVPVRVRAGCGCLGANGAAVMLPVLGATAGIPEKDYG